MSNFKKHFFHISKSWFSVCTFIFLLAVCVGLAIHVISKKENAICSDSDNSELPIVSNENVSEGSGSDIEYAKNYVPTEENVLAARQQATEGMSQQQVERLTEVIKAANLWLEQRYMDENLFEKLSDPNSLYWNYFHQTGEIQIGWAVDGSIDIDAVCKREKLSLEEFYATGPPNGRLFAFGYCPRRLLVFLAWYRPPLPTNNTVNSRGKLSENRTVIRKLSFALDALSLSIATQFLRCRGRSL